MEIAEKKKAIFESTLALVRKYGFHGTPMSMIAKESGVATGTIYHYFTSKEQLLNELYVYVKGLTIQYVESRIGKDLNYKEEFFCTWRLLYQYYARNSSILLFYEQYVNSPYNSEKRPHNFQGKFFEFLERGRQGGELKDVKTEVLVALFVGSAIATAKLRAYGCISFSEDDLNQTLDMLWIAMKNPG